MAVIDPSPIIQGRGSAENPANRFVRLDLFPDPESHDPDDPGPSTIILRDSTRRIIATNDSPDVGFEASINPYRGCEHGCIYCYARPSHEYLGFSAGLDFETRILAKVEAAKLLRRELASPKWTPKTLSISGVTDCYQPIERKMKLTRQCLEVLAECKNPVGVITKNALVTRDIDLLSQLAKVDAAVVFLSITTLDNNLASHMEPRASAPQRRLAAIAELADAGIKVGVMVAPVIPGLTDHEMPGIISAAVAAGAQYAGYVPVRLPFAVAPLFEAWLERHFPDRKDKVLNRIRSMRGGKLNDPNFVSRMRGEGIFAEQIKSMFEMGCKKAGIAGRHIVLSTSAFVRPRLENAEPGLFDFAE